MGKKIKLLVFTKTLDGGTGTFVLDFLDIQKFFGRDALKIKTLVLEKPSFRKIKDKNFTYWAKANYYSEKYTLSLDHASKLIKEIFWFEKHVGAFNPDLVLTIDSHCMLLCEITKFLYQKRYKTMATIHNNLNQVIYMKSTRYLHWVLNRLMRFFLNRADLVSCVSEDLSKNLYRSFALRMVPTTIYNGISFERGHERSAPKNKAVILSIARFAEQKDHETLLKAFHLLQKEKQNSELWLAGEGPLRKKLEHLSKHLKIENQVKFLGWIQNPASIINKSDVLVLSSKREGFGYVLIEAMSLGVPVISTNAPFGPAEVLGYNKYGILVQPGNPHSLKRAILKVLDEDNYRHYSRLALDRSKYFSKSKMLKTYKKHILKTLIN